MHARVCENGPSRSVRGASGKFYFMKNNLNLVLATPATVQEHLIVTLCILELKCTVN